MRDLTGAVVSGCEIVGLAGFLHDSETTWLYRCRCGVLGLASTSNVNSGIVGCGCTRRTHRQSKSPLYPLWRRIHYLCYDSNHPSYRLYGARGVTVCRRWRESASDFISDVGPMPKPNQILALIDEKRGFCPGNVQWITPSERLRGRGAGMRIEYRGQQLTLREWARRLGTTYKTLYSRVLRCQALDADLSEAVATPIGELMPCLRGKVKRGRPRRT